METRIMKVLKRNKYKYGVWQSMERAGGAVPQTPFCCARFLGLFSVQQPLVASWVTPNTLEFYWCQRKFLCHLQGVFVYVLPALLGKAQPPTVLSGKRGAGKFVSCLPSPVFCTAHHTQKLPNPKGSRGHLGAFHPADLLYPSEG